MALLGDSRKLFLYQKLPESYFFTKSFQKAISLPGKVLRKLFLYQKLPEQLLETYFFTKSYQNAISLPRKSLRKLFL